jgi:hypothetical protein
MAASGIITLGLATSVVLGPVTAVAPQATSDVPQDKMTVAVATVNGTGCRPGTAAIAVSPDNLAFTVTYSEYIAEVGPGIAATAGRKNCQLNVQVNVPGGFTFAIAKADYRGYADLAQGASALQKSTYYFAGMSSSQTDQHTLTGPKNGDWQFTDQVPVASLVWHPCGAQRNLNINTELRATKGTSTDPSYIAMDSVDGSFNTILHYQWQRC